jgi:hypothetical protein
MCARCLGASLCGHPITACLTALQCVAAEEKGPRVWHALMSPVKHVPCIVQTRSCWNYIQSEQLESCMLIFLQVLQKAGLPDAQLMHLSTQVFQLQCAFDRMALVKEYRYCTSNFHSPLWHQHAPAVYSFCVFAVLCSRSVRSECWCGSFSLVRLVWQMSVSVTCLIERLSGWTVLQWLDDPGSMSQQFRRNTACKRTLALFESCRML